MTKESEVLKVSKYKVLSSDWFKDLELRIKQSRKAVNDKYTKKS